MATRRAPAALAAIEDLWPVSALPQRLDSRPAFGQNRLMPCSLVTWRAQSRVIGDEPLASAQTGEVQFEFSAVHGDDDSGVLGSGGGEITEQGRQ